MIRGTGPNDAKFTLAWQGLWLVLVSIVIRGGLLLVRHASLQADPDAYRAIAESLARTGVLGLVNAEGVATPTAFRPPLYPWLLSWCMDAAGQFSTVAVAALHVSLGVATVWLTWDLARRWWSVRVAWIAAILVLIDPMLLWQSTLVMTETLATFLVALTWWWWGRVQTDSQFNSPRSTFFAAATMGGLLSLTILCRPTFLVWAVMLIGLMWFVGPSCRFRRSARVLIATLMVVATVGAWTLRNVRAVGHPVWATTHGGYTLLLANNDSFYDYLVDGSSGWLPWNRTPWDTTEFFESYDRRDRGETEHADDQVAYQMAKTTIQNRPMIFVASCFARAGRLWHPFPMRTPDRSLASVLAIGLYHTLAMTLACVGVVKHFRMWRVSLAWPAIALVLTLTAVHAVYWSNPRMRSPAIPVIAIAAAGVFAGSGRLRT